jgi:hypothetical protein
MGTFAFVVQVFLIVVGAWAVATLLAAFAYKLSRGYEAKPALSSKLLWSGASVSAFGLLAMQAAINGIAASPFDANASVVYGVLLVVVYVPMGIYLLTWCFDLDSLLHGLRVFVLFHVIPVFAAAMWGLFKD